VSGLLQGFDYDGLSAAKRNTRDSRSFDDSLIIHNDKADNENPGFNKY